MDEVEEKEVVVEGVVVVVGLREGLCVTKGAEQEARPGRYGLFATESRGGPENGLFTGLEVGLEARQGHEALVSPE